MINRRTICWVAVAAVAFAAGVWYGRKPVPVAGVAVSQIETPRVPVVSSSVGKETDMTTRALHVDGGVTNRFRTLKAYHEFMRTKNPAAYGRLQDSRRQYEERTFAADEKRIRDLREMNLSRVSPEQRADIQTILDFNEELNAAVDALNAGAKINGEELNRRYRELYQVFEREKKRQVEVYGKALGAPNLAQTIDTLNALTPQQFFQRYWIVNEKLKETQEEKK